MSEIIEIHTLNKQEALRYMGVVGQFDDQKLMTIIKECEEQLLIAIRPKYVYRVFNKSDLQLPGESVNLHLAECDKVILLCATISSECERLIRAAEVQELTKSLVLDTLASVAVEEVCNQVENIIKKELPEYYMTWRYGVGYGDTPLSYQEEFLRLINASKQIGVCVTSENLLTPRKSVTCFIGLSETPISKGKRGCSTCNMKQRCQYRKRGEHCGF